MGSPVVAIWGGFTASRTVPSVNQGVWNGAVHHVFGSTDFAQLVDCFLKPITETGTAHVWHSHSLRLINTSHFAKITQGSRTDFVSRLRTSQPRSFGLTSRPRFQISKSSQRFQAGNKNRLDSLEHWDWLLCTECRCESGWHSRLNR